MKDVYLRRYKNNNAYKWWSQAAVNVSVTEDLTGKTYFGTTKVVLRRTDVELTFPQANPKSFKPNVPFQILVGCSAWSERRSEGVWNEGTGRGGREVEREWERKGERER